MVGGLGLCFLGVTRSSLHVAHFLMKRAWWVEGWWAIGNNDLMLLHAVHREQEAGEFRLHPRSPPLHQERMPRISCTHQLRPNHLSYANPMTRLLSRCSFAITSAPRGPDIYLTENACLESDSCTTPAMTMRSRSVEKIARMLARLGNCELVGNALPSKRGRLQS
jgi:hypothetical protein